MSGSGIQRTQVGIAALVAAILGGLLMAVGFVGGVSAALTGSGAGADGFVAVFFVGVALVAAALVTSLVRLVRGAPRVLSWITLVIALLPGLGVIALRILAVN